MAENEVPLKNSMLESFVSVESYDRGHSGGQEEVDNIANGLRYDLRAVDNYIADLERQLLFARVDADRPG
jgi:hypothetical protein